MAKNNKFLKYGLTLTAGLLLAACGDGGGASGETGEVDIDSLPEPGDFSETIDLHLSGSFTQGNIEDGNWVQERLEEKFNVNIENTKIDTWNNDETSIMVASGDVPDVFSFTAGGSTPIEFYEDGLTRTIPREMIEEYAPLYAATLDEVDNGLGWEMNQHPDNEDEYLSFIGVQNHSDGILWAPTLRLDWMENLGLEIPEDAEPLGDSDGFERIYRTDQSLTLEELEEILHAFTYDDPNGTGSNDTYGLLPYHSDLNWATTLFGAHGVAPGYNLEENGELVAGVISEGYKDTLKVLADWYEKGLIDPEWTTLTAQTAWEKFSTGSAGYFIGQRTYLAQEAWTQGRAPHNVIQSDPNAKLIAFAPELGPDGQRGQPTWLPVTLLGDAMFVSADVTDEQLARYLQMFDFLNHDDEGIWTVYGEPGEHSEWQGEEGNSTLITKPEYPREEGDMGFWAYNFRTYPGKRVVWLSDTKTMQLMDDFFNHPDVVEEMAIRPHRHDLFNETNQQEVNSRYGAQLATIQDEFRMGAITGEVDIDAEWDNYVETWRNNGGNELLEEMEKAPLVSDLLGE